MDDEHYILLGSYISTLGGLVESLSLNKLLILKIKDKNLDKDIEDLYVINSGIGDYIQSAGQYIITTRSNTLLDLTANTSETVGAFLAGSGVLLSVNDDSSGVLFIEYVGNEMQTIGALTSALEEATASHRTGFLIQAIGTKTQAYGVILSLNKKDMAALIFNAIGAFLQFVGYFSLSYLLTRELLNKTLDKG